MCSVYKHIHGANITVLIFTEVSLLFDYGLILYVLYKIKPLPYLCYNLSFSLLMIIPSAYPAQTSRIMPSGPMST